MTTVNMTAPAPFAQFEAKSANRYAADANGLISGVPVSADVLDLLECGCQFIGNNNFQTIFGGGAGTFTEEGSIYKQFSGGTNPANTGGDYVVGLYTLPAGSFDVAGRALQITAAGNFANNANTKTVKIIFNPTSPAVGSLVSGGTTIASTGAYSTTGAAGWQLISNVWKYGVTGSNTQAYQGMGVVIGGAHSGMGVATALTATESSAIPIAVTINAATTATDTSLWQMFITAMN